MKILLRVMFIGALLLLTFPIWLTAQDDEAEMSRTGFRLDAPTYAVRGPHPVGTMDMTLDNEERPLPMTIWYPALNPDGLEEAHAYPVIYPPVFPPLEAYGMALFEAAPDLENGPYPLVVWSHGFTSFRTASTFFGEHLASWGFVVIAPDHLGMTSSDVVNEPDTFYPMYYETPSDVSRVIDFAETMNADGLMAGMIDMENIASAGHSSGGFTALQAAGGQLNLAGLLAFCESVDNASFDCPFVVPKTAELLSLYGLDDVPEGLLPSIGDERIDAVVPLAPDQLFFGETGLSNVTIPTLYMAGEGDMLVPYDQIQSGFASLGSETAFMVTFDNGGHFLFQDTCERFPAMIQFGLYNLCADPVWDMLRVHDLINHHAAAFLLWQLTGDEMAATVFTEPSEVFMGVEVISR